MTFDDLKLALDEVGRRADEAPADSTPLSHAFLHRSRSALGPLRWLLMLETVFAVAGTALLVGFLVTRVASPWTVVASGWVLLFCELAYLVAAVRQLVQLAWIDFAAPMLDVQNRLAALWVLRSRVVRNVFLIAPLVWLPMLIVAVAWITGGDLVAEISTAWVISNLAFGLAILGGGLWIAHARPGWVQTIPWLRDASDHLAGRSLRRALGLANEAVAFSQDAGT
ncbi:MAG: hypothetical protein Rubg2KO_40770 [Rubricoccaceae bacterium]